MSTLLPKKRPSLRRILWRLLHRAPRVSRSRMQQMATWNSKLFGEVLARQSYATGRAGPDAPVPAEPQPSGPGQLAGRLCNQADMETPWMHHWCGELRTVPWYHRKIWEDGFVLQAIWEAGLLGPGRRALGFAVGQEPLPAYLAARGMEVVATDLDARDYRAEVWTNTGQHAVAGLFRPDMISRADFEARVSFRAVDMTRIPTDLQQGQFDLVWSVCSLEHLGSITAGLHFIETAMRCLKPGGVAVHTTEFDMDPLGPSLHRGHTVLFQQKHIAALASRMEQLGHRLLPMDFSPGEGPMDIFIDQSPYAEHDRWPLKLPERTPHLRVAYRGRIATSIGLVIQAKGG